MTTRLLVRQPPWRSNNGSIFLSQQQQQLLLRRRRLPPLIQRPAPAPSSCSSCVRLLSSFCGRRSEEYHIANAIRQIREMNPQFVVQVLNASSVAVAPKLFPAQRIVHNAPVVLRVLTHADQLSEEALRYQMDQAEQQLPLPQQSQRNNNNYNRHNNNNKTTQQKMAVMALNLTNADKIKFKHLRNVTYALLGGAKLAVFLGSRHKVAVVCGIPNAGKSSLIHPLTKQRTLEVRKKKSYHLPKISSQPGCTLGTKRHVLEIGEPREQITLLDTPGLRPRLGDLEFQDHNMVAQLIAMKAIQPVKGLLSPNNNNNAAELQTAIVNVLLQALNRHGDLTSTAQEATPYLQLLGLEAPTRDPQEFLEAFKSIQPPQHHHFKGTGLVRELVRQCHQGSLGGMIFEEESTITTHLHNDNHSASTTTSSKLMINRNGPLVCFNDQAKKWIEIGMGQRAVGGDDDNDDMGPPS